MTTTTLGFEGVEKRLELVFKKQAIGESSLRKTLTEDVWNVILSPVDCKIEYSLLSPSFDTYLLSASSLFVFDDRVVIKTCGNTKIFKAISLILLHYEQDPIAVKFTRGTYLWPERQPYPHQSFETEAYELRQLVRLEDEVTEKLGCPGKIFHVIAAAAAPRADLSLPTPLSRGSTTVEILMTTLDKSKSSVFFQNSGRGPMITASGIDRLFPGSRISDMEFPECGYSMNGIIGEGGSVYTIHVTPEEGFSYASFELCQIHPDDVDLSLLVESVVSCFNPANFTVAIVGSSKFSGELILKNRVVQCREIKALGAWGTVDCYFF